MTQKSEFIWSDRLKFMLFDARGLEIMKKAIFWYGTKHQLNKCKEECMELVTAIHNYNQQAPDYVQKENSKVVVDEIADVLITAIQAAKIVGVDEVIERIKYKLTRLDDRIERQMTAKNMPTEVQK